MSTPNSPGGFIYPYSFVRLGRPASRRPPATQERFSGLCGRILCTVDIKTPLCIPDSEGATESGGHWTYKFFRFGDDPAVPGSSLKGAIRSLFETITQSALSIVDTDAVSRRLPLEDGDKGKALLAEFVPAIVLRLPDQTQDGQVGLFAPDPGPIPNQEIEAHSPGATERAEFEGNPSEGMFWPPHSGNPNGLPQLGGAPLVARPASVLHFTGRFGTGEKAKRNTMSFVFPALNATDIPDTIDAFFPEEHRCSLPAGPVRTYNTMRESLDRKPLRQGQLIYVKRTDRVGPILAVADSRVPRVGYDTSIGDLLSQYDEEGRSFLPPTDRACLDPASRVFGVVTGGRGNVGAGGILRFQSARPAAGSMPTPLPGVTLRILGRPRPTAFAFYLRHPEDNGVGDPVTVAAGRQQRSVHYDDAPEGRRVELRGRKHYWHHPEASHQREDYDWMKDANASGTNRRSNQNATVELLQSGKMAFEVSFEALEDWELGALLWSLSPSWPGRELAIRLGRGKSLGLGSAKIDCAVSLIDRRMRYRSWGTLNERPGEHQATPDERRQWEYAFLSWLAMDQSGASHQGARWSAGTAVSEEEMAAARAAVDQLPFWADLLALLDFETARDKAVRFPRFYALDQEPANRRKFVPRRTFDWFKPFNKGARSPEEAYVPLAPQAATRLMPAEKEPPAAAEGVAPPGQQSRKPRPPRPNRF